MSDTARYTLAQISSTVGLSPSQIRGFVTAGVFTPERGHHSRYLFSFDDVVVLRTAAALIDAGVPTVRVRSAIRDAREDLPDGVEMSQVILTAVGEDVVARHGDSLWDPSSRQAVFDLDASGLADSVASLDLARRARRIDGDATADEWFLYGDSIEADDADAAESAYRTAIELDASHAEAHLNLGRLLHDRGDAHGALEHYRHAIELYPQDATAWFNAGVAYEDTGADQQARESYEEAIRVEPAFSDAHFNLATLHERTGDELSALRHLREYRKLTA
jgi:tetratricopeptide (TPR) repeat protein